MYFSDDESVYYETTYSQDERIGFNLQQEKEKEAARNKLVELERKQEFDDFFKAKTHDICNLAGLTFLKFTHLKIKFSFDPSKIVTHVSKKVIFYCSLKYYERYKIWNIRRDSFPVNYKSRMYRLFCSGEYLAVGDDSILNIILRIYAQLQIWAKNEETFRMEKFMPQQNRNVFKPNPNNNNNLPKPTPTSVSTRNTTNQYQQGPSTSHQQQQHRETLSEELFNTELNQLDQYETIQSIDYDCQNEEFIEYFDYNEYENVDSVVTDRRKFSQLASFRQP
ncbi:hypothetical protein NQ314_009506 [Rhamnusium bicolor]|uniref:Uncharacterized protein n=1 Tax=Rhamnusium bicolor TaxID=1586634 RepID=A0AAV8XZI3_9CUCU|nr:hypothetical protein NQ314_009506 [Rhamnusium bicolor]